MPVSNLSLHIVQATVKEPGLGKTKCVGEDLEVTYQTPIWEEWKVPEQKS